MGNTFRKPRPIRHQFPATVPKVESVSAGNAGTYTAATGKYNAGQSQRLMDFVDSLKNQGQWATETGADMFDPSGQWMSKGRRYMRENIANNIAQTNRNQGSALAARGFGGGGMGSLLGAANLNRGNAAMRQGEYGLISQGAQIGGNLFGQGVGALSSGGQIYGSDLERALSMQKFNLSAQNDASKFNVEAKNKFALANAASANATNRFNVGNQINQGNWSRTMSYNQAVGNNNAQDAWRNQWMNMGGQVLGAAVTASDIKLKDNIEYLYNSSEGHKVYAFNYKGGDVRYKGVMAQDLLKTNPEVVSKKDGILNVDYSKIDVNMEVYNG